MNVKFRKAVAKVKEFLDLNNYAYGTRAAHMRCYRLLDAHLTENGELYSRQTAEVWLNGIAPKLCGSEIIVCRRALEKLDAAYKHRDIGGASSKSAMRQTYRCLESWCNTLLEEFTKTMSGRYGPDYTQAAKASAARFLRRMTDIGACGPEDMTHRAVADYCRRYECAKYTSKQAVSAEKGLVRKFLQHLCEKGIVRASVPMTLDQSVYPRLVFLTSLSAADRDELAAAAGHPEMSAESFYETALRMNPFIVQHKYAQTAQQTFPKAYKELFVFLEANSFGYSARIALLWTKLMSQYTVQWMSFRRAVMLFEQFRTYGQIDPCKVYRYKADRADSLPAWCKADYDAFIRFKEKAGFAKSTLDMCRSSCFRLLRYLSASGISSWKDLSAEMLKAFHRQDAHATPEGKNACSSKIRGFLEYLGDRGLLPPAMFLAIPNESARRDSIVKTLSEADISDIRIYRDNAGGPLQMRDAAIVLIGLRMGLRASDITKLRFEDISWEQKTISLIQQKTGKFLRLPMPVEVGNAIYRYLTEGRPETDSGFIFVRHKTPYSRLGRPVCLTALRHTLPDSSYDFRVTRKTFASRMLINDVAAARIAETLGHVGNSSVMAYLSTNNDKMRLCAISPDSIPVKGGILL
jgi:site-specific recombinase XerD